MKTDITSVTLSWKAPTGGPNITSYIVGYSTDWQKWIQVSTGGPNITSYIVGYSTDWQKWMQVSIGGPYW